MDFLYIFREAKGLLRERIGNYEHLTGFSTEKTLKLHFFPPNMNGKMPKYRNAKKITAPIIFVIF